MAKFGGTSSTDGPATNLASSQQLVLERKVQDGGTINDLILNIDLFEPSLLELVSSDVVFL